MPKALLFSLLFLLSCSASKKTETGSENKASGIFFFVFKISRIPDPGKNSIELVSKTIAAGKLKKDEQDERSFPNSLAIDLYEQDSLVKHVIIEHPLFKQVEYTDSNKVLRSKFIELDKADFFLRMQITERSTTIRISEKLKNKNFQELKTIEL